MFSLHLHDALQMCCRNVRVYIWYINFSFVEIVVYLLFLEDDDKKKSRPKIIYFRTFFYETNKID